MNFPDEVTVLRSTESDAYGNDLRDWTNPEEFVIKGFEVLEGRLLLLPPSAPVLPGDRFRVGGQTYAGTPDPIRSPSARKLYMIKLDPVED